MEISLILVQVGWRLSCVCVCVGGGGGEGEHFNYFENPNVRNSAKAWMQEFFQGVEGFEVSKKGLKHSISDGLSCARLSFLHNQFPDRCLQVLEENTISR